MPNIQWKMVKMFKGDDINDILTKKTKLKTLLLLGPVNGNEFIPNSFWPEKKNLFDITMDDDERKRNFFAFFRNNDKRIFFEGFTFISHSK